MTKKLGLYVHWPFCAAKCPYCDFNSHVRAQKIDQSRFVRAFERELQTLMQDMDNPLPPLASVFIGGGTPSLMDPQTIADLLDMIRKSFALKNDIEITMEANPSSVEAGRFAQYRQAGVNRVSLGVQSLKDSSLKFLGRLHNAKEALQALEIANTHFERTSIDLIYALPDQSLADWRAELKSALDLGVKHLSAYQLTIEPDTAFYKLFHAGKIILPEEEQAREMYLTTQDMALEAGLRAYEISNHASAGHECEHNLIYWRAQDYLGIGPGAHGRIEANGKRYATSTELNPEKWLELVETQGHGLVEKNALTREEICDEFLLMGLRLQEGIDMKVFEALRGAPIHGQRLEALLQDGMVQLTENNRLCVTREGSVVLDAVVADLAA